MPDCSGEAMLALGLGVETGVDEKCGLRTAVVMDEAGASRVRSGVVMTVTMVSSKEPGRILFT